jgi:hypothetical protein
MGQTLINVKRKAQSLDLIVIYGQLSDVDMYWFVLLIVNLVHN